MRVLPRTLGPLQVLSLLTASLAFACGGAGEPHPERVDFASAEQTGELEANEGSEATAGEEAGNSGTAQGHCEEGDWKECRVQLPQQGGVENCFVGVQLCEDGAWSACK